MSADAREWDAAPHQYLAAEYVVAAMAHTGRRRLDRLGVPRILLLGVLAGGFVTAGAVFSVLLVTGIEAPGLRALLFGSAIVWAQGYGPAFGAELASFVAANLQHSPANMGYLARANALSTGPG